MPTTTTAQLRTAIEVLNKLAERLNEQAAHSVIQMPESRLGDDYATRIVFFEFYAQRFERLEDDMECLGRPLNQRFGDGDFREDRLFEVNQLLISGFGFVQSCQQLSRQRMQSGSRFRQGEGFGDTPLRFDFENLLRRGW
jgi:hypothetical protein